MNSQRTSIITRRKSRTGTEPTCVSETERPEAQIWCSMRDTTQTVLYGVDTLMDYDLTDIKLVNQQQQHYIPL